MARVVGQGIWDDLQPQRENVAGGGGRYARAFGDICADPDEKLVRIHHCLTGYGNSRLSGRRSDLEVDARQPGAWSLERGPAGYVAQDDFVIGDWHVTHRTRLTK